jgi:5-methylcytosine-specific restriction endonuclease McrA
MSERTMKALQELLEPQHPIAFHRLFAVIAGGALPGLFLSQAWYWSQRTEDPEGWFYKTMEEWTQETGMTRREQEHARSALRQTTFWEEQRRGAPAQLYYRIVPQNLLACLSPEQPPVTLEQILQEGTRLRQLSKAGYMRACKAGVHAEFVQYATVLRTYGLRCGICGDPIRSGLGNHGECLVFDHLVSIFAGGPHTLDNLRPAHGRCNGRKGPGTTRTASNDTSLLTISNLDKGRSRSNKASLLTLSKLDCLDKANLSAYPKQTSLLTLSKLDCLDKANMTEISPETTPEIPLPLPSPAAGDGQTPDACAGGSGEAKTSSPTVTPSLDGTLSHLTRDVPRMAPAPPPQHSDPALAALYALPPETYAALHAEAEAALLADGTPRDCCIRPAVEAKMLELAGNRELGVGTDQPHSPLPTAHSPAEEDAAWIEDLGTPWQQALARGTPANGPAAREGGRGP